MDIQEGPYTYTGPGGQKRQVPIKRVYSFSQLHKGDHFAIKRLQGLYCHHAIVEDVETENDIIIAIEYSSCFQEVLRDINNSRSPGKAKVMRDHHRLEDGLYVIKHNICRSAEDVVNRARSKLEEKKYNLFSNNCEHFAMWCKTGISSSEQVKNMKEIGLPLVVGLVAEIGEKIGRMVCTALNGAEKEAFTQYLANGGQIILQYGPQITLAHCIPSLSKGGQAMTLNGGETALEKLLFQAILKGVQWLLERVAQTAADQVTQAMSKGGQWVFKKVALMAAEQIATRTSTTTRTFAGKSLLGGAACGALIEGAIGVYDIYWAYAKDLKEGKISQEEYNDTFGKRVLGGVGSVTGATVGAAVGQAFILVPVVGGIAGSVFGGNVGRLCGNLPWSAKEIGPPLVVGLVAETGEKIVMTVRATLNGAWKEALRVFHFHGAQTGAMQWVLKKVAQMAAEQVATQTSTTTRSLIRGAVCGALVEGAIGVYDICWVYKDLKEEKIREKEYNDAIGKRILDGVGNVTGATAGAAVGQALISVPVVGGIVGSVLGGGVGRLCGNLPWSAKEIVPPLVVGLVSTVAQGMLLNGAQTGAKQALTQYLAMAGQIMLQYGPQTALGLCFSSLSKCGQAMMLNGGKMTLGKLLSQSISKGGQLFLERVAHIEAEQVTQAMSKGGQWVLKKVAQMAAEQIATRTSTTTRTFAGKSLLGGAACGALIEGAIGVYDIYWAYAKDLKEGKISQEEYNDAVGKRVLGGVGSVTGATVGAAVGQALISVPVVGGIAGSVFGGVVGRLCGNLLKSAKEIGPPLVVGLVYTVAQGMLLNGAQTGAKQALTQYLAMAGQIMLQYGPQIALGLCFPSLSKCGQAMMLNGGKITLKKLLSQSISKGGQLFLQKVAHTAAEQVTQAMSKGGQWVLKKVAQMAAEKVPTQTSTTTRTFADKCLLGGAACGALIEGAIGVYDIYWAYAKDLKEGKICQEEYNDAVGKRVLGGVGSVAGATAGAAVGQAFIPVPVVGGIVGSVLGGMIGRFCGCLAWNAKTMLGL